MLTHKTDKLYAFDKVTHVINFRKSSYQIFKETEPENVLKGKQKEN